MSSQIKPIRTEADYQAALQEVEKLIASQPGSPDNDRLEVLVVLIEAYEARNFPIPEPDDPVAVLKYYMESRGLSRSDLIPYLGSKERVSEVLNRKRRLSLEMIRRLHHGLGIPADLLIGGGGRKPAPAQAKPSASKLEKKDQSREVHEHVGSAAYAAAQYRSRRPVWHAQGAATKTVDVLQERKSMKELLAMTAGGAEVILAEGDKPIAHLVPVGQRIAGLHAGAVWTSDDFDEPLPDEFWLGTA
jgi:HTH-type transcriptional regulator/antitoxin HigA